MYTRKFPQMRNCKFNQAISEATVQAMLRDASVCILGEGVDNQEGIFGTTKEAFDRFGAHRVVETPLSENAVTGMGLGMALAGLRPIMVHARNDFLMLAMDQIVNHIAKWSYLQRGNASVSLVIRALIGRGWGQAAQHSQSLQALFAHIPGLKVVMPSTPYTAKGLLLSSIFDGAPVVFLEHRWLYGKECDVPKEDYRVALGKAVCQRPGRDITIVASSLMVYEALEAADVLCKDGIDVEVIDLLTICPLDEDAILASVRKTGRVIIADTGWKKFGISAEIAALIGERAFGQLKAPVVRIGLPDAPTPCSSVLEDAYYPGERDIIKAAKALMRKGEKKSKAAREFTNIDNMSHPNFSGPF